MFHSLKPDLRRRLLSFDYPLDVIQLVQRFERCQVVHIQVQYLVAYLAQHRVVELEETELHAAARLSHFNHCLLYTSPSPRD